MTFAAHFVPPEQRQRLLLFNLRTDADDHILGFTSRWIRALAPYYGAVDVLTTHAGRIDLPDNVRVFSVGREDGLGRTRRLMRFYGILGRLLATHRYDACFAHMQPLFAALGGPLLTLRGVRTTTWYTHRQHNAQVAWAERLSYRVVSAVPSSFPIPTKKLRALGHGIETDFFTPAAVPALPRVVYVARLTEIKRQHWLLQAAKDLACEIVLVGDIPDGYDDSYKQRLQRIAADLGIADRVIFAGAQTPEQVRDWYRSAAAAVNLSPPGLFDKAALEAMATAIPVVVANEAFAPLTGEYAPLLQIAAADDNHAAALHEALAHLLALPPEERAAIGTALRERVVAAHSLEQLVEKLIAVMHTGELPL